MRILTLNNTKFIHNRYLLNNKLKLLNNFKQTFNNLPIDQYHSENKNHKKPTRLRRYSNYNITIHNDQIKINHNPITTFQQNVEDERKNKREFELIESIYHPIILEILNIGISYTKLMEPNHNKFNISVHQIRQMVYPNITSHNSIEGIHQDGCDYIISAFVIDKYNIKNGTSIIYDKHKHEIYQTILKKNEYIFQNDKDLYHYITPNEFNINNNNNDNFGYRDIIGLDIDILK
tara:strand:- start:653 stop:1354 length:702 start_codon:yes stop_codon:yes gene_type:complete